MSAACLFCKIVRGEMPAQIVHQDKFSITFLDHRPLFHGHCLLMPRTHVETLGELPPHLVEPLFLNARLLSRAVQSAMEAQGTFVAMNNTVSQSVPHLHIHVVPRRKKDGLRGFFWPRTKYSGDAEMAAVKEKIAAEIEALSSE